MKMTVAVCRAVAGNKSGGARVIDITCVCVCVSVCGQTEVFTLNPILLDWKHIEEQKERKLAGPA